MAGHSRQDGRKRPDVPTIYVFLAEKQDVDARDERGHDD